MLLQTAHPWGLLGMDAGVGKETCSCTEAELNSDLGHAVVQSV